MVTLKSGDIKNKFESLGGGREARGALILAERMGPYLKKYDISDEWSPVFQFWGKTLPWNFDR